MKEFELTPAMLTIGGMFYPKGYAFVMFADAEDALQVANEIESLNKQFGDIMLLSPATVMHQIGKVDGESNVHLPSVGTEGATVHKYVNLARQGHHALMVQIPSDEHAEHLMVAARKTGFAYAQRYHLLAMEDLE